MKYAFLLFFNLMLTGSLFGQKIRFTDSSNHWLVYRHYPGATSTFENYSFSRDTSVNSTVFKQMSGSSLGFVGLIREDPFAQKVYVKNFKTLGTIGIDTSEQILYDYTLKLHDTLVQHINGTIVKSIVWSFDSIVINGTQHKVWQFSSQSQWYWVIEGIGCTIHPYYPITLDAFEIYHDLKCFSSGGGHPAISPPVFTSNAYFDNTTSCTVAINSAAATDKPHMKCSPNPIDETTEVNFGWNITGIFYIINGTGETVYTEYLYGRNTIKIGKKIALPGIYYCHIVDETSGQTFTGKFVKQ